MDFTNYKFRCSSLGALMTDPRSKSEVLSETCKAKLIEIYIQETFDRCKDIGNKYIAKGLAVEDDAITLFSLVNKKFYKKNEHRLVNDYITGEPDLFIGESLMRATHIIEIKSSWDIWTFFKAKTESVNKAYLLQLQGYMFLTGAKSATLAYCLVNTPEIYINDEKRKLFYKLNAVTEESPLYLEACEKLEREMIFDDIPMRDRMFTHDFNYDQEIIDKIKSRVEDCRAWLNTFSTEQATKLLIHANRPFLQH